MRHLWPQTAVVLEELRASEEAMAWAIEDVQAVWMDFALADAPPPVREVRRWLALADDDVSLVRRAVLHAASRDGRRTGETPSGLVLEELIGILSPDQ